MGYKKLQRESHKKKKVRARATAAVVPRIMGVKLFVKEKLAVSKESLEDPIKGVIGMCGQGIRSLGAQTERSRSQVWGLIHVGFRDPNPKAQTRFRASSSARF